MEQLELKATFREQKGKGAAKRLRKEGLMPGIFYSSKSQPVPLILDPKELERVVSTEYGSRILLKLTISGYDKKKRNVMVKDIQIDPVSYKWIHADLYGVDLKQEVEVDVPIKLTGVSPGVKMGGILEQIRRELTIKALPKNIPSAIEIDISSLELGDSIHLDDVSPENYTVVADSNFTIVTVSSPEAEVVEEEVEEEEVVEEEQEEEIKE